MIAQAGDESSARRREGTSRKRTVRPTASAEAAPVKKPDAACQVRL